jgi:primase-polymerase (primpol)-like protein
MPPRTKADMSILETDFTPCKGGKLCQQPLQPIFENIPASLRHLPQWVTWRLENRHGRWAKPAFDPRSGRPASVTDPGTWTTFALVADTYRHSGLFDGIGFVFTANDPFVGVDLDHCRNLANGHLDVWAEEVVAFLASYAEMSPSGTGVKILVKGSWPHPKHRRGNLEVYDQHRFFTLTGHRLDGAPEQVLEQRAGLDWLAARLLDGAQAVVGCPTPASVNLNDSELLARAFAARNGSRIRALWEGHTQS